MFTSILRTPAKDGQEWKCRGRISRPPISYKIEGYTEDGTFELIGEGFFNEEWLCTAPPPERNPEGTVINSTFAFGDPNLSYGDWPSFLATARCIQDIESPSQT